MTTAFVLSGGASLAAVQVGMLQALAERGVAPDLLVGTSAGSLNAAFVAGHGIDSDALARLRRLWTDMRRATVFPLRPGRAVLAAVGARDSLCSPAGLRDLLGAELPFTRLEDASTPLHVVTTDVLSGRDVVLTRGDAIDALMASSAIPGVLPPVRVDERLLCDGALAGGSGVAHAVRSGADRVYLLPGGTACALERPPRHPLAAALHAVTLLLAQRAHHDARRHGDQVELHVLPPLCPLAISGADFGRAPELIERALRTSRDWLAAGQDLVPHPERTLALHAHRSEPTACADEQADHPYQEAG